MVLRLNKNVGTIFSSQSIHFIQRTRSNWSRWILPVEFDSFRSKPIEIRAYFYSKKKNFHVYTTISIILILDLLKIDFNFINYVVYFDSLVFVSDQVSKEEYDSCHIANIAQARTIAVCDKPFLNRYYTITFRPFTPQPGGLEFHPGQDYYFIALSAKPGDSSNQCQKYHMKVVFKVCCGNNQISKSSSSSSLSSSQQQQQQQQQPPRSSIGKFWMWSLRKYKIYPSDLRIHVEDYRFFQLIKMIHCRFFFRLREIICAVLKISTIRSLFPAWIRF